MNKNSTSFDYIKNHHEVPLLPDENSRFKWIKKFISKCLTHFTTSQNSFNNNVAAAIQELNNNNKLLAEQIQNINIRQDNLVKSLEKITGDFQNVIKRQDEIIKNFSEKFSGIDNRQNDLVKSLENTNCEIQNSVKRQDDIIDNFSKQINQNNNRQSDIVKSFEKISEENQFLKQKQQEIEKFVQSTFFDVDNRQNLLVESLNDINEKIAALFKRAENAENGFTDLRALYEQIAKQNAAIKNAVALAANSKTKAPTILKNFFDNSFYAKYEDTFRGSEKIVKKRLQYYINKIKNIKSSDKNFILDVGCGRGEFVDLLIKNNFHAKGIDINSIAVQQAVDNNLPVENADLFAFLNKRKENSLAAVSAFHVIEHLRHNDLISFFRLAFDKIQPSGKLLLETPNMLNLFVAACDFYKDPTHIRPLHPATLQFYLQEIGFKKVEVNFLHPFSEKEGLKILKSASATNSNFKKLNELIFGARDCSIIAEK